MIVSRRIAEMFRYCGFVNVDYLVKNKLERNPSKILNILNRDWRKWVKPLCMLDGGGIDPNFGYESIGLSSVNIEDYIRGSVFTCPEAGTAINIKAYLNPSTFYSQPAKASIYLHSDLSLKGSTTETVIDFESGWFTFTFSTQPSLTADTEYVLEVWAKSGTGTCTVSYDAGSTNQGHSQYKSYNADFPNPLVPIHSDTKFSIYCAYVAVVVVPMGGTVQQAKLHDIV